MFKAEVILDSLNPYNGVRLITMELTYPRFIHCFDDKTEIMCRTESGPKFLSFSEAKDKNYEVAAYSREHDKIFWERPVSWINESYNGDMIELDEQQISFSVTPNHRLYVKNRTQNGWNKDSIIYAKDWFNNQVNVRFKKSAYCAKYGDTWLSEDEMKLLGFFIGDGTISGNQAIFHLKKQRKIDYLCGILDRINAEWSCVNYADGTVNVKTKHIIETLKLCYNKDKEKRIPYILTQVSTKYILALFDGLKNSDGNLVNESWEYNTSSSELANQIQAIAALNGMVFNLRRHISNDRIMFKFRQCISQPEPLIRKDRHKAKLVSYDGKIYCCTVSTGLIMVRRNGIVHISGNSEVMTHRMFSRNSASSRAIPIDKTIKMAQDNPAMPIYWGKNQKGMAASEQVEDIEKAKEAWLAGRDNAVATALLMKANGIHKQITNRVLEPWLWHTVICTATEWSNFFALRDHKDAQPEIAYLARLMKEAQNKSVPVERDVHLPYIRPEDTTDFEALENYQIIGDKHFYEKRPALEFLAGISSARCARVSYLTHDGIRNIKADCELFQRLLSGSGHGHWSPMEHPAFAIDEMTEMDWSGNFRGWLQYRKTFNGECQ